MTLSKFEKQTFATLPKPITTSGKGSPQRENIPRTTQVRRLYRKAKAQVSLKRWAMTCDESIANEWLAAK